MGRVEWLGQTFGQGHFGAVDRIADRWIGGRSSVDRQDCDRWSVGR
jgi:hypothetical protein